MPGIGKTTLAVHAAHRICARERCEVRLHVNLRGYDPVEPPADPAAVLDGLLRQLGVPGQEIYRLDLFARSTRFRQVLDGRRALLLLDNAADEHQVRPLLPDSPTCVVIVTSRRRLTNLPGARRVALDVLTPAEADDMLRRRLGRQRVRGEERAASDIIALVGRLPLAIALVAARINATPEWTLADHRERLIERRDALRLEDGVEIALAASYDALPATSARLLRLLSLHPGHDVDAYAAAALFDSDLASVQEHITTLCDASLLQERASGRYEFHDSVRTFAANRAREDEPRRSKREAHARLADYYRSVAAHAAATYFPPERELLPTVPSPSTPRPDIRDSKAAVTWLDSERSALIRLATDAADNGWDRYTSDLSNVLYFYLDTTSHHREAHHLHAQAVDRTRGVLRARSSLYLATAAWRLGRYPEARNTYRSALDEFRRNRDRAGESKALMGLGNSQFQLGQYAAALDSYQRSLELLRQEGDRVNEAAMLSNLGEVALVAGKDQQALGFLERSLLIARQLGHATAETHALQTLGRVHARVGSYAEAVNHLQRALDLARASGQAAGEAEILSQLGSVYATLGDCREGLELQLQALRIVEDVGARPIEIQILNRVGTSLTRLGMPSEAVARHRSALTLAL